MAYQSLQPSPIAAAWGLLSAALPVAVVTRRLDSACVYSWRTTAASSPPLTLRAVGSAVPLNRYICMTGVPAGGTGMSALLTSAFGPLRSVVEFRYGSRTKGSAVPPTGAPG